MATGLERTAVDPMTGQPGQPLPQRSSMEQTAMSPLMQAYQSYQQHIGQPFQQFVRGGVRGYFGLPLMSDASSIGREAYRQAEVLGFMPGVGMPAGAVRVAAEGIQALPSIAGDIGRIISSMPSPKETAMLQQQAANDAAKAIRIATFGKTEEELAAGLKQAQANNTFAGRQDPRYSSQYGVHMGFPQPKGTPSEKIFSNFADSKKLNPDFREAMFGRALANRDFAIKSDLFSPASTVLPFKNDLTAVVEANKNGNTRVQIISSGKPIAAARIENGMLDSIAVAEKAKGQDIGYDLLKFLHTNDIANVLEVPDRSPGFVKIQKRLVEELKNTEQR
jgi:hypothetical protein